VYRVEGRAHGAPAEESAEVERAEEDAGKRTWLDLT